MRLSWGRLSPTVHTVAVGAAGSWTAMNSCFLVVLWHSFGPFNQPNCKNIWYFVSHCTSYAPTPRSSAMSASGRCRFVLLRAYGLDPYWRNRGDGERPHFLLLRRQQHHLSVFQRDQPEPHQIMSLILSFFQVAAQRGDSIGLCA